MSKLDHRYDICVVDIGSPKLGNIGWCYIETDSDQSYIGQDLDDLIPRITHRLKTHALLLGLEAPLCVPLRDDLMLATKGRKGEGRRPWSAGAGAQVLAMNLPIMTYLFQKIKTRHPNIQPFVNEEGFLAHAEQMMIFEALVSGTDKGNSHIDDAAIMAEYCLSFAKAKMLPPSILEQEDNTEFFNLTAASLLRSGLLEDTAALHKASPIYKPSDTKS